MNWNNFWGTIWFLFIVVVLLVGLVFVERRKQQEQHQRYPNYYGSSTTQNNMSENTTLVPKTLNNTNEATAKANVPDIAVTGFGNSFAVICKASSQAQGWMKSTKGYDTGTGVIVQVTTQQKNPDGTYAIAEALTFVPGVKLVPDERGDGKGLKLVIRYVGE